MASRVILAAAFALMAISVRPDAARVEPTQLSLFTALPSNGLTVPAPREPSVSYPSPQPGICGVWTAYAAMTARYGELRNCGPADSHRTRWVITTLGEPVRTHGVIALYTCTTAACRDGRNDHPMRGWKIYPAPYAGGVTWLGQPTPDTMVISNGGHEIVFDLVSRTYGGTYTG
jgi:hypothetical protein